MVLPKIDLFSDCKEAVHLICNFIYGIKIQQALILKSPTGHYFDELAIYLSNHPSKLINITWVKGHPDNIGNIYGDHFAKIAATINKSDSSPTQLERLPKFIQDYMINCDSVEYQANYKNQFKHILKQVSNLFFEKILPDNKSKKQDIIMKKKKRIRPPKYAK